jgi:hemerythrin-like metal-binding protein
MGLWCIINVIMADQDNFDIIVWEEKYATGITLFDNQHKELFSLNNELFRAFRNRDETLKNKCTETMSRMVEYVRFHFSAELELLHRIKYPQYQDHKKQHDELIRDILEAVKEFNEGKKFVPNQFVRTLRDWILSHIALADKLYAAYISEQKRHGLLNDRDIEG